ncbi:prepilin-type N-terminal cleavage/methylation domain-containing protein [Trichlorobacter thiogenes]|uniref:Prepilin-type N-terminal cleavage/methylation domain-containing protein n=1 Tax=Trichlorobacter thiogenes TaxID=115783 RepID=A0A1T4NUY2_9BACT|nr:prepilin-type N-terminal cleavage/methylation domain-containing protein [Trichlorobacter thiogenes]SJZ82846.1 prepilin-type N-terminal cleavage/methylation domain-containing protein [Trichlorobacter thiogenes]
MKNIRLNSRGFSLVEMALVLVVVGIVIGIGAGMIGPLTTMSKVRESREIIESSIVSVSGWSASNNRLPTFTPTLPDTARFDQIVKSPIDSWGRPLIYLFDANLAPSGANLPTKDTICGRKTTAISITDNTAIPAVTITNVAFAITSQGEDALTQTTLNGTLNGAVINGVITGSGTATGTITLDPTVSDIARWVTLDELRSKIGCQGAQLKILNNELPAGSATTAAYAVTMTADGGIPYPSPNLYRWCIQTTTGLTPNANMTFAPAVFSANCAALAEGSWGQAGQLAISWPLGTAPPSAAYSFTIFVRDNNDAAATNDNIASKAFVLTVNP